MEKISKHKKINGIKAWLQMFGERDNECFSIEVKTPTETWDISMQYNYDLEDGYPIEPMDWCRRSFKHVGDNAIRDRSDKELDEIIECLNEIKVCW
jgi:hypothetical protein